MGEIKKLIEKKAALKNEILETLNSATEETRALTDEESAAVEAKEKEIKGLSATIAAIERAESINVDENPAVPETSLTVTNTAGMEEIRSQTEMVNAYIRGEEVRAGEMSTSDGVIPIELSSDIIKKVVQLSNILGMITIVNSKGDYKQIVASDDNKITAGWTGELDEIVASKATFSTVTIGHHKLGSLAKISRELINQNDFDIFGETQVQMLQDFAVKSEAGVFYGRGVGTSPNVYNEPIGLSSGGTSYELQTAAITSVDIVSIFHKLKSFYHPSASWQMSNDTLCLVRQLRDSNGQFLFHQAEMTQGYVGTILGKPVYISDCMEGLEAGKTPIFFGDFKRAYKANINPQLEIQVLRELYATSAAIGILGIMWIDGRPVNDEAYVTVSVASGQT